MVIGKCWQESCLKFKPTFQAFPGSFSPLLLSNDNKEFIASVSGSTKVATGQQKAKPARKTRYEETDVQANLAVPVR